jgi:hypothetical protein
MSKHVLRVAPAVLLTLSWLPAQTGGDLQQQVDQQVREMRKQVEEGKTFRSHVRVTVHLKNGNTIRGVVKDSLLVERIDGLRFVAAEENEAGAGMRIYYWNGSNSFVFVPYADMRRDAEGKPDCKINGCLTPAQLRDIELANKKQDEDSGKAHAAQDQPAAQDTPPADDTSDPKAADGKAKDPAGGLTKEQQDLFALVQEYPPQAGWCQDKRDEIARRLSVIGAKPSDSELRFVARFSDWLRACALFHLTPTPPAASAANGNTTNGNTAANTNTAASTSRTGLSAPSPRVAANNATNGAYPPPTPTPPPQTNTSGSGSGSTDDSRSTRRSRRDQ